MAEYVDSLTSEELEDFKAIVSLAIEKLLECADKHNIDRDSFMKYFADTFSAICKTCTFSNFGIGGVDNGSTKKM